MEGYAFLGQLSSARMDILPRQREAKSEYLAYVPLTWILVNNVYGLDLSAKLLWDMMVLTVCNFGKDEYMETVVARCSETNLEQIKFIIYDLCFVEQFDRLKSSEAQVATHNPTKWLSHAPSLTTHSSVGTSTFEQKLAEQRSVQK